ncbi:hypothetical protein [Caldithrix abyssi]
MKQVCPQCATPISRRWLLLGSPGEMYTCPNCKTNFQWTGKRYLVSFLAGLLGALPILLFFYFDLKGLSLLTVGLIYLGILAFDIFFVLAVPGQFRARGRA